MRRPFAKSTGRASEAGLKAESEEKSDTLHGLPVHLTGNVHLLYDGVYRHIGPYMTGQRTDMGKTAVVECGRLTVVLTEKRAVPWDLGHVRALGLWPDDYHIVVVKSAIAWQAAFGAFAKSVIYIDSSGCCAADLRHLPYRQLPRPIYPLEETNH
jgi:microcystin degradation protein MlrC